MLFLLLLAGLLAPAPVTASFRLTILHTNDMHSRLDEISAGTGLCTPPTPCYGGFARVASVAKTLKQQPNTIFLNAGDNFQGTAFYSFFKWRILADFIDLLGIDVMCLGNHEFDDGPKGLAPYLAAVRTPSVSANVDTSSEPSLREGNLHDSWRLTVDGVNITVIGYLTPETEFLSASGVGVKFLDEIQVLTKAAEEARRNGAKIVIALGHSGFDKDVEIAQKVPDVDVVVGGHTDTFLYTGTPPDSDVPVSVYPHMVRQTSGKTVPVVQAFGYTKYLGHLVLNFDNNFKLINASGNPILLDSSQPQDVEILEMVKERKNILAEKVKEVLGLTRVDLDEKCRLAECNSGNFITDGIIHYNMKDYKGPGWTDAPICLINGGSIRARIMASNKNGSIDGGDMITMLPFFNLIQKVTLSGSLLTDILEFSVSKYDPRRKIGKGSFLQVSGLRVTYDISRPVGSRVSSVEVRCGACTVPVYTPLNTTSMYTVLTSSFLVNGGDGYRHFLKVANKELLDWRDIDSTMGYIQKMSPIHPGLEGRITIVGLEQAISQQLTGGSSQAVPAILTLLTAVFLSLWL